MLGSRSAVFVNSDIVILILAGLGDLGVGIGNATESRMLRHGTEVLLFNFCADLLRGTTFKSALSVGGGIARGERSKVTRSGPR